MNQLLAVVNGATITLGQGGLVAVVAAAFVFLILGIIIAITYVAGLAIDKVGQRVAAPSAPATPAAAPAAAPADSAVMEDEDAAVAVLVASIDYRNETKQDVKVVSVKEIK